MTQWRKKNEKITVCEAQKMNSLLCNHFPPMGKKRRNRMEKTEGNKRKMNSLLCNHLLKDHLRTSCSESEGMDEK